MADAAANGDLQLYIDLRKVLRRMVKTEGDIHLSDAKQGIQAKLE